MCHGTNTDSSVKDVVLSKMKDVSKSSISVSSNGIDRFLNFALKTGNRKFHHIGICDEGVGLVGVEKAFGVFLVVGFVIYQLPLILSALLHVDLINVAYITCSFIRSA